MDCLCENGALAGTKKGDFVAAITDILELLGEDADRDGLRRTPSRVADALEYMTSGTRSNLNEVVNGALFAAGSAQMVTVCDIDFFSLCEHHMLPFFGTVHVAYLPGDKIIGLSKIPRIVNMFARRLQVQERLTSQIAEAINQSVSPRGVGVVVEAEHMCMAMRGVEKQNSQTVTSAMTGEFTDDASTREQFLTVVGRRR